MLINFIMYITYYISYCLPYKAVSVCNNVNLCDTQPLKFELKTVYITKYEYRYRTQLIVSSIVLLKILVKLLGFN